MEENGCNRSLKDPLINQLHRRNTQSQIIESPLGQDLEDNANLRRKYDQRRFSIMFFLTGGFFLAELVTAMITGSLAMMGDAMHMLSDFIALLVGYYSLQYAKKMNTPAMTYGYSRAEVIGALFNSAGLLAICFTIVVEAIQRFIYMESMSLKNVQALLWVAVGGLIINLLGMVVFGHSHSHGGGHDHSHGGGHGHSHGDTKHSHSQSHAQHDSRDNKSTPAFTNIEVANTNVNREKRDHSNLNVEGVWLHVLGDALGSVAVIISASIMEFTTWKYREWADPVCSIFIAGIITYSTVPLLRKTVRVLMHATPRDLNLSTITETLLNLEEVLDVHDVHAWSLTPGTVIGTAHLIVKPSVNHSSVLDRAKRILHNQSIHSSVIQIEAANDDNWMKGRSSCYDLICEEELSNPVDLCCQPKNTSRSGSL